MMPSYLTELYEALDEQLDNFLHLNNLLNLKVQYAAIVSALCAAIEIKQTQELHEFLNEGATWSHAGTPEEMWDKMDEENEDAQTS